MNNVFTTVRETEREREREKILKTIWQEVEEGSNNVFTGFTVMTHYIERQREREREKLFKQMAKDRWKRSKQQQRQCSVCVIREYVIFSINITFYR